MKCSKLFNGAFSGALKKQQRQSLFNTTDREGKCFAVELGFLYIFLVS